MGNRWSVTGLILDLPGFTILAVDLYRDYSQVRARWNYQNAVQRFLEARKAVEAARGRAMFPLSIRMISTTTGQTKSC